jgi:hypothetical protein
MGATRIFGGILALLVLAFTFRRYRRGRLSRGEFAILLVFLAGLVVAATVPSLYDYLLEPLGFEPGGNRRLIGLLFLSNMFAFGLVFLSLTGNRRLANELGDHVDYTALRRLEDEDWAPTLNACAVVIPAFNEAEGLPLVLNEMPKEIHGMPVEVIVVADGCTDDTEGVAKSLGAHVIRRELRRGQGAAIRLGYLAALRGQARVIVSLDADGQHDPHEMERLIGPLASGEADMVQGSRILGTFEKESKVRATGVHVYAKIMSTLGRTKITDPANGYRAVTPEALQRLDLRQDQFVASELIMDAMHKGLRVEEVPITVRRRAVGETKKGTTFRYAWGFSRTLVGTWLRQPSGKQEAPQPRWLANAGLENGSGNENGTKAAEEAEAKSYAGAMSGEEPPQV